MPKVKQNPSEVPEVVAVYESLLQPWEWSVEDRDGNQILEPEIRRVILDVSPDRSLTATVSFLALTPKDIEKAKAVNALVLKAVGITEEIKDKCELYLERIPPEAEEEYLKFALKME